MTNQTFPPTWTDERTKALETMWDKGLSATQVAQRLGGVSRAAVLGKVHRMGLKLRGQGRGPKMDHGSRSKKQRTKSVAARSKPVTTLFRKEILEAAELRDIPDIAPIDAVTFADLEPHHCRWPYGDPKQGLTFCGCKTIPGISYCAKHAARAFATPSPQRKPRAEITAKAEKVTEAAE